MFSFYLVYVVVVFEFSVRADAFLGRECYLSNGKFCETQQALFYRPRARTNASMAYRPGTWTSMFGSLK